jgi:hypothetical protein
MSKRRLFSSDEILAALKRKRADGRHDVVVVLGKKEVPDGTLQMILTQAQISYEEFPDFAKVKRKGK